MPRVYHPYTEWEDWRAGLYSQLPEGVDADEAVADAARLLRDWWELERAMRECVARWPNAAEHNLTNPSRNKRAWLGQGACCLRLGVPEDITKAAWRTLDHLAQINANAAADRVLRSWDEQ